MAEHTKGPWEAVRGEVTTPLVPYRSYRRIAVVQDYGLGSLAEVDEANAQLIAAAPELLEAVEYLLSVLSKFDIDIDPETYDRDKYFDLITKAKGGS